LGLGLTIVLLDNGGGGIFDFLPVAGEQDIFEQHVATPTGLDFSRAAALYGIAHEQPRTLAGFRTAVDRAVGARRATGSVGSVGSVGSTMIEVRGDRPANVRLHAAAAAAVDRALSGGNRVR